MFHVKLTHNFKHIEITAQQEPIQPFQTGLTWDDRADLRLILKIASQSAAFTRPERDLALRLLGELDQLPLEF
jgi:hypothetical protein